MENYRITTDSNSDLPSFLAEKYQTVIIPQYYAFGDEVYGDEKNMTPAEFYNRMREGALPSSMANNPAVIRERFEGILKKGFDILHIAFSSALSGSYNNVCVAAQELMEEYPERKIAVVDSLNVSLAETILFLKAHQLQEEGRSLSENAAFLEEYRKHINVQFTVDDLFHLKRGGRVSAAAAVIGSALGIKPVLHVDDEGHLIPVKKVRGRRQSLDALVEMMAQTAIDPQQQTVFISHGDSLEDAKYVEKKVQETFKTKHTHINFIGPVIGAHSGPGTIALFFLGTHK